jgi:hypothetical protein
MGAMASVTWDEEFAAVYDDVYAWQAEPSVVEPIASVLAELAGGGAALEFGVGTGRIALALSAREVASRESSCRRTWLSGSWRSPAPGPSPCSSAI